MKQFLFDLSRALAPFRVAVKYGMGPLLRSALGLPPKGADIPTRMRSALEALGLTYLKIGQYLAMRLDILPLEVCRELDRLFENATPIPFDAVKAIIESELQGPLHRFFSRFDEAPLASASVAQVHEAHTPSGQRVAVKVQRPGIERIFAADMRNLRRIGALVDGLGLLGRLSARALIDEFEKWTSKEFDFVIEGRAADRMRAKARAYEIIPLVHWELTTHKVLSLEFIDGISLNQLISLFDQGREDLIHARLPGLDLRLAGHNLAHASLHQIFDAGFFHGDPHPGNIMLLADNSVAYIDFGICGRLSPYNRDTLAGYIECLALGDASGGFRYFSMLSVPTEDTDFRAFESQSKAIIPLWYRASRDPSSPFEDLHMSKYFFGMVDVARRNHVRVSADTLLFWRAMNALNYSALKLSSHFDLMDELQAFFKENRPDPVTRLVEDLGSKLPEMAMLLDWPAQIGAIIDRLAAGDAERAFAVEETRDGALAQSVRLLVPALVALSLTILALWR